MSSEEKLSSLIEAKILALLHDPPGKWIAMEQGVNLKPVIERITSENEISKYFKNVNRRHEKISTGIIISIFKCLLRGQMRFWGVARQADIIAASFDRIMNPEIVGKISYGPGLINPFEPGLFFTRHRRSDIKLKVIVNQYRAYIEKLIDILKCYISSFKNLSIVQSNKLLLKTYIYHIIYTSLPVIWTKITRGEFVGPADTHVPHHLLFDHLWATASAVNLHPPLNNSKDIGGLLVYIGYAGLRDWLSESRKLSDLWVSSWLPVVMIWYAIKDLIWRLGPDIVLIPSQRWNHYYLSLLKKKLEELGGGEIPGFLRELWEDITRFYYFDEYHQYPVHAWLPAYAYMLLPIGIDWDKIWSNKGCNGECGKNGKDKSKDVVEILRNKISEAWRIVVTTALQRDLLYKIRKYFKLEDKKGAELDPNYYIKQASKPPLKTIIFSKTIKVRTDIVDKVVHKYRNIGDEVKKFEYRLKEYIELVRQEKTEGYEHEFIDFLDKELHAVAYIAYYIRERSKSRVTGKYRKTYKDAIIDAIKKFMYIFAFHRVIKDVAREKHGDSRNYYLGDLDFNCKLWRHCTVCGWRPAVFYVPGKMTDNGPSREYREFARDMDDYIREVCGKPCRGCRRGDEWKEILPIFKPGEKLCIVDLVKRLLGVPCIFRLVAEKLVGYEPPMKDWEPSFPSTDDLAALATKLSLARLTRLIIDKLVEEEENVDELYDFFKEIIKELTLLCDKICTNKTPDKREVIDYYLKHRPWLPRLLDKEHGEIINSLDRLSGKFGVKEWIQDIYKATLAVLVFNRRGFYDWFAPGMGGGEISRILRRITDALKGNREYSDKLGRENVKVIIESLTRPRLYYYNIWFDADNILWTLNGLIFNSTYKDKLIPIEHNHYMRSLTHSVQEALKSIDSSNNVSWIMCNSLAYCAMKRIAEKISTILVSPSYHSAISHSLAITLYTAGILAEDLGGVAVYLAGDEGLVLLPAWLPRLFYDHRRVNKELFEKGKPLYYSADSPGLIYTYLLRRFFWGADTKGYHSDLFELIGDLKGFLEVKLPINGGEAVYYVPALVGNGLSTSLRASHYKDHLRSELSLTKYILEKVKEEGDRVGISYGRLQPRLAPIQYSYVTLRNTRVDTSDKHALIDSTGKPLSILLEYLGRIYPSLTISRLEYGLSSSFTRDLWLILPRETIESLSGDKDFEKNMEKNMLWKLVERNIHAVNNVEKNKGVRDLYGLGLELIEKYDHSLAGDILPALQMIHQAIKSFRRLG